MPAKPIAEPQRLLEIDLARAIEAGGTAEGLGGDVEAQARAVDGDDGETASGDRNAVANPHVGDIERSRRDRQAQPVADALGAGDATHGFDDAGEHQRDGAAILARMRQSSPTRSTLRTRSANLSSREVSATGRSNMPRAGSPSRQGAM